MTQSAITSALNGKVSSGSTTYLPGVNLDQNGAYIYGDGTGNILFRYKRTSTSDYSYMNMVTLINTTYLYTSHSSLVASGTNLNDITDCGGGDIC